MVTGDYDFMYCVRNNIYMLELIQQSTVFRYVDVMQLDDDFQTYTSNTFFS